MLKNREKSICNFINYTGVVNRKCKEFNLATCPIDQFKCLMFVCGLTNSRDFDIRTKLLTLIETKTDIKISDLTTKCVRILKLEHDTAMIRASFSIVSKVGTNKQKNTNNTTKNTPKSPCWSCVGMHILKTAHFKSINAKNAYWTQRRVLCR